jgi:hypothetical protein
MGTTYLKRQKEMKRLEKQRAKAERRAQKKLANRPQSADPVEGVNSTGNEASDPNIAAPSESKPQN